MAATVLAGILLLLGWAYLTAGNPRSGALFKKSIPFFLAPIILAPWASLSTIVLVTCEEGLKAIAASTEARPRNRFWLVTLFGVWELTLSKPFWGLSIGTDWSRLELAGMFGATLLPVLMHTVTAAIYAFDFQQRLWVAFVASWLLHYSYNWLVGSLNNLVIFVPGAAVVLGVMLLGLWRIQRPDDATGLGDSDQDRFSAVK